MIGGHFLLVLPLNEKQEGAVWQAMDTNTGHQVALFQLSSDANESQVQRFFDSMERVRAIEHINVVVVMDHGRFDDGQAYVSMELLDGTSLADRLSEEPPLSLADFIRVTSQTLDGLTALHGAGVIHGRLEPDSVFILAVLKRIAVKVIGMGRVTVPERILQLGDISLNPKLLHAMAYCAPELLQGEAPSPQSDIYSLGVVMFEALTGKFPFQGSTPKELKQAILSGERTQVNTLRPEIPSSLSDVINRAIMPASETRFGSTQEMKVAMITSLATVPEGGKKIRLPVVQRGAGLEQYVVEWDASKLAADVDPKDLDRNVVIQVRSQRRKSQPPGPRPPDPSSVVPATAPEPYVPEPSPAEPAMVQQPAEPSRAPAMVPLPFEGEPVPAELQPMEPEPVPAELQPMEPEPVPAEMVQPLAEQNMGEQVSPFSDSEEESGAPQGPGAVFYEEAARQDMGGVEPLSAKNFNGPPDELSRELYKITAGEMDSAPPYDEVGFGPEGPAAPGPEIASATVPSEYDPTVPEVQSQELPQAQPQAPAQGNHQPLEIPNNAPLAPMVMEPEKKKSPIGLIIGIVLVIIGLSIAGAAGFFFLGCGPQDHGRIEAPLSSPRTLQR